jgi:glucose 1-dehydrogenase
MPENTSLQGQVALVTGASSGIGRACALALANAGARIAINHRGDAAAAEQLAQEIADGGGEAVPVRGDVSLEEDVEAMFAEAIGRFGTIHVLVNNAGVQRDSRSEAMTLEQWRTVIDINLTGQFLCARAALREFLRRGPQPEVSRATGNIICISSVHQVIPWAQHVNYAASKGGVMLLVKSLAQEFAHRRIRVNAVAPGAIRTRINRSEWETDEALQKLLKLIPYGRIGDPEDVGRAVRWLASDESDYVTGTTLTVDGGMELYPAFAGGEG